jgi:hypothetical protein
MRENSISWNDLAFTVLYLISMLTYINNFEISKGLLLECGSRECVTNIRSLLQVAPILTSRYLSARHD